MYVTRFLFDHGWYSSSLNSGPVTLVIVLLTQLPYALHLFHSNHLTWHSLLVCWLGLSTPKHPSSPKIVATLSISSTCPLLPHSKSLTCSTLFFFFIHSTCNVLTYYIIQLFITMISFLYPNTTHSTLQGMDLCLLVTDLSQSVPGIL